MSIVLKLCQSCYDGRANGNHSCTIPEVCACEVVHIEVLAAEEVERFESVKADIVEGVTSIAVVDEAEEIRKAELNAEAMEGMQAF